MEDWRKDARHEPIIVDLEALVPEDHLLRKIEKVMDYEWLYERLSPYYCHNNGRPGTDPVVLIKMVLIQHLFGIPSLRQTYQRIQDTISYRWFLGYGLLDEIPHFATVSYAFCKRFPEELSSEIFEHILNKALNNRMVDPSTIFIDGTHIKASANKKKFRKEQVAKAAKVYSGQLRREVNEEREKLGKKPIEDDETENDDDENRPQGGRGETVEKTVSTTDPECGMFVKGEHERVFADVKEKHAMRYTHHRGLAAVTRWVRLKFAAMNLKKLANWSWKNSISRFIFVYSSPNCKKTPAFVI